MGQLLDQLKQAEQIEMPSLKALAQWAGLCCKRKSPVCQTTPRGQRLNSFVGLSTALRRHEPIEEVDWSASERQPGTRAH
jgi:hypothetical protein